ncbi:GDSL-type esterase/lipase family protein [Streptomyces sp. PSAA01]|uniref:GDSL-type esterase/lipase family protein n=2 Tax=Streptomyces TaxID=1883 RepID=UPI001B3C9B8E|nr:MULTISPECIES: GDSL-type esterase/lipase family protein [Streptomyces]MCG0284077.1 GDSL-type esterase/lipase family protein [Streptomyces sp. PSAA01]
MRRSRRRRARLSVTTAVTLALVAGATTAQAFAADGPAVPRNAANGWSNPAADDADSARPGDRPQSVPVKDRTATLGKNYRTSNDTAWTTSGDGTGFHLLTAVEKDGYRWRTAASLSETGFDTDTWIGNACVTASGKYAAVAYAPRTFTNKPEMMTRGAFTAVVDLDSGTITKLPFQATLGYFSPGCGHGDDAVFTALTDDSAKSEKTRLVTVDAATGKVETKTTVPGQVTSAIPVSGGIAAARGNHIVKVNGDTVREVATTKATPFELKADADGGVTFIDRTPRDAKALKSARAAADDTATVSRVTAEELRNGAAKTEPSSLAKGRLMEFDLSATPAGQVYVTGKATSTGRAAKTLHNPGGLAKDALVSSRGQAAVTSRWADGKDSRIRPEEALTERTVRTTLKTLDTGRTAVLDAIPGDRIGGAKSARAGNETSPVLAAAGSDRRQRIGGTDEPDRYCSVPRGNAQKQAFQPTPRQIEWAVDQAVVGKLNKGATRAANWKNTGMAAYAPQTLFPLTTLKGGSGADWHVPAQVMLGVTAQESNMWQAARTVVPGVTGNALIGNYYGIKYSASGDQKDPWAINFADADCGYGVTQVTDGMRMHGKEKDHEKPKTTVQQEAVALDYSANIAAGVNILIEKWNDTRADGLTINGGDPKYIENWFYALWAYNAGYYPKSTAGSNSGKWGVGWTNNPANPLWKANRPPFLEAGGGKDDYSHASHPQDWPYEEKVIGWAARPISAMFAPGDFQPGYRAAWWNTTEARTRAKPPLGQFCNDSNNCDQFKIGTGASNDTGKGPCTLPGDVPGDPDASKNPLYLKCWYHEPASWKDCKNAECGNPIHRFDDTYPEQPDANSYPPRCNTGLPAGALIVDDLPNGTVPAGSSSRCGAVSSQGSFALDFATASGRIDMHQIGAGNGNHFWFAHTRSKIDDKDGGRLYVKGTWTLNSSKRGWMRVYAHMPDHGAHTRQATYLIGGTDSTSPYRVHPQRVLENKWVDLGVFNFTGTPTVSLDSDTQDGTGDEDIAWDSVAFQPLSAKPKNFVVAMGDSYSSGEGATEPGGKDYYAESDYYDKTEPKSKNSCHRSKIAWSRQATLPGYSKSIGALADSLDANMDYHFIACSGARTFNILNTGRSSELAQLKQGYLDQNTSLVTLSVGGNDARFTDIVKKCVLSTIWNCQAESLDNINPDNGEKTGGDTGRLEEWAPKWLHEQIRPRITATLKTIHDKAPNAEIVLMGYPRLLEDNGSCVLGMENVEGKWLNSVADILADEMKGAVDDANSQYKAKAVFSDPRGVFTGKAICGDPESVHGIVISGQAKADNDLPEPSMQSFHPKPAGARLYADSLEKTLKDE